jgi:hypothetical protein
LNPCTFPQSAPIIPFLEQKQTQFLTVAAHALKQKEFTDLTGMAKTTKHHQISQEDTYRKV